MNSKFLKKLDLARDFAKTSFVVTSGYRCPLHNGKVGGKDNSAHVRGYAADIACKDSVTRQKILHSLQQVGFKRIGINKEFIHVDSDPEKPQNVTWLY
jgi:uncharacterized protein YcbK (DUF882 family)